MTLRYTTNNITTTVSGVMWFLYSFFRTASPNGPGWTIIGTSNGTTGGMADGYVSTLSDFNANNSWFAMQSPDGYKQFYFLKFDSNTIDVRYCKTPTLTGGVDATPPSSADARQLTNGNYVGSNCCICADDAYPYGWYMFWRGDDGNHDHPVYLWLPIDNPAPDDDDPYAMLFCVFGAIDTYAMSTNYTIGSDKSKCWDGATWKIVNIWNGRSVPKAQGGLKIAARAPVVGVVSSVASGFYKGYSTFVYHWPTDKFSYPSYVSVGDNNEWLKIGDFLFPWNGDLLL